MLASNPALWNESRPRVQQWVYLRIYLGQMRDRCDQAILHLGRYMDRVPDIRSWFYIRYVDEGGPHLRWRVLAEVEHAEAVGQMLVRESALLLRQLHTSPADTYFRMVSSPELGSQAAVFSTPYNDMQIVRSIYEPEYDKFGGQQGMPIAEKLFHESSFICLSVIEDEMQGIESRKSLVPWFMSACHSAFGLEGTASSFWSDYSYYWLGGRSRPAEDWQAIFQAKRLELRADGAAVPMRDCLAHPSVHGNLMRWEAALKAAARAYSAVSEYRPDVVCFNIVHLMNNRLGLTPLEEAYMASLLEHSS